MKSLSNNLPRFFTVILMLSLLVQMAYSQNIQERTAIEKVDIESNLAHGQFSFFKGQDADDMSMQFMGDGAMTARMIMERFLSFTTQNSEFMIDFAHSTDAQKFASESALQFSVNSHLQDAGMFSESPIPQGEIFTVSFTELKKVLTPYKGQTEELRKALFEISEARNKTILEGAPARQNK